MSPFFEVLGLFLSRINVTYTNAPPPKPYLERLYSFDYDERTSRNYDVYVKKKPPKSRIEPIRNVYVVQNNPIEPKPKSYEQMVDTVIYAPPLKQQKVSKSQDIMTTKYEEPITRQSYPTSPKPQHFDSYDQIPSKNSSHSDSMQLPPRSYRPKHTYYDKTESFKYKAKHDENKLRQSKRDPAPALYYESNYYSPYKKPDNLAYIDRIPVNTKDRPKWKI